MLSQPSRSTQIVVVDVDAVVVRAFVVNESGLLEPPPPPTVTISKHRLHPYRQRVVYLQSLSVHVQVKHPMRSEYPAAGPGSGLESRQGKLWRWRRGLPVTWTLMSAGRYLDDKKERRMTSDSKTRQ